MPSPRTAANPFALMTHPQAVLAAVEASPRLGALRRRICRPLDRGLPADELDDAVEGQGQDADADTEPSTPRAAS